MKIPETFRSRWIARSRLLLNSYRLRAGHELMPHSGDLAEEAEQLFTAHFAILSHGTEADPILDYANATALHLWEMTPEQLVQTPSRLTAEPAIREARECLLNEISQRGFYSGYQGVRVSRTGRRFRIEDATIWNVTDDNGEAAGQAAAFARWTMLP